MTGRRVMLMAAGTGGHVFPALAVATMLRQQGIDVMWLGTGKGIEARVVPQAEIPLQVIDIAGVRGKGVSTLLLAPLRILRSTWQAFKIMRQFAPHVVLGMGGYVTGPGGVAARLAGYPLVIHEQNAIAGLTNRWLAALASRVLFAFPNAFPASPKTLCTGNPLRAELLNMAVQPPLSHGERPRVLVVGGSLGAQVLNEVVPQALAKLESEMRPEVWHQAGERTLAVAEQQYQQSGVAVKLLPFIEDMAAAYSWADIVICRAGALTVSEVALAGVPAIFVPLPIAVDDHQTHNAEYLASVGAARICPQSQLTPVFLAQLLRDLLSQPERLLKMSLASRSRAKTDATQEVVNQCLEVAHG